MDLDIYDVFDLPKPITVETSDFTSRVSLALAKEVFQYVYEITINYPIDQMSMAQHIQSYKYIWEELKKVYKVTRDSYFIEYCKSGQAHLHGYIEIEYPANAFKYEDEHFLKDVAKTIFKKLPKKYYKQFHNAKIIPYYRQLKTPALLLNLKNILETNWVNYIKKNAP